MKNSSICKVVAAGAVLVSVAQFGCSSQSERATEPAVKLSRTGQSMDATAENAWLNDGILLIARPLPVQNRLLSGNQQIMADNGRPAASDSPMQGMLGFVPAPQGPAGFWLSVERSKNAMTLMNGTESVTTVSGDGLTQLPSGSYQLLHKQRNPLWYAPDNYFSDRLLPVPPEGDRTRFRRGALGEFVLFVTKDTPIHSGPYWSKEVGGVRLDEADLSRLYYQLELGATIQVE